MNCLVNQIQNYEMSKPSSKIARLRAKSHKLLGKKAILQCIWNLFLFFYFVYESVQININTRIHHFMLKYGQQFYYVQYSLRNDLQFTLFLLYRKPLAKNIHGKYEIAFLKSFC